MGRGMVTGQGRATVGNRGMGHVGHGRGMHGHCGVAGHTWAVQSRPTCANRVWPRGAPSEHGANVAHGRAWRCIGPCGFARSGRASIARNGWWFTAAGPPPVAAAIARPAPLPCIAHTHTHARARQACRARARPIACNGRSSPGSRSIARQQPVAHTAACHTPATIARSLLLSRMY